MGLRLFWITFAGVFASQTIGTVHVLLSNRVLFLAMADLHDRGLLTVPNEQILPSLGEMGPALFGGLFFTFTLGIGLTVLTLLFVQTIRSAPGTSRFLFSGFLLLFFAFCLISVNKNGFNPVGSAYFLFPPALTAGLALRFLPGKDPGASPWKIAVPTLFFLFSLPFLVPVTGLDFFHQVRDRVLLSHPWGIAANDFYYRYTLHAAEAVKSFQQKLIRTYRIDGTLDGDKATLLNKSLNYEDVFLVSSPAADLVLEEKGDALSLGTPDGQVLQVDLRSMLTDPSEFLERYSTRTDRWGFFRKGTFCSMIVFYPAALFFLIYTLITRFLPQGAGPRRGPLFASGFSFLLLAGAAFLLSPGKNLPASFPNLPTMIQSGNPGEQGRALRMIFSHGPDIASFPRYDALGKSPSVIVRYWFARCLEKSRSEKATALLLALMEDGQINVATTAIEVLAKRGDRGVIPEIRNKLIRSDHWYVQWYAYRALRRLGWCQAG